MSFGNSIVHCQQRFAARHNKRTNNSSAIHFILA